MLGDGSLGRGATGASYSEFHAKGQLEYVLWKMAYWGDYAGTLTEVPPKKATHQGAVGFRVRKYDELLPWWEMFYANSTPSCDGKLRKKFHESVIPMMTPLALAVWYMDDGMHQHWPSFSCHERSHDVALAILAHFGIQAMAEVGTSSRIVVRGEVQARAFLDIIKPYILDTLRYKLAAGFLCRDMDAVNSMIDLALVRQLTDAGSTPKHIALGMKVPIGFIHTALSTLGNTKGRQRTWPDADLHHLVTSTYTGRRPKLSLPKEIIQVLIDQGVPIPIIANRFGVYEGLVKQQILYYGISPTTTSY